MSAYQTNNSAEARRVECARLLAKYPGQTPIVAEMAKSSKVHFLALPRDATVAELEAAVHAAFDVSNKKLALAIEGCSPAATATVGDLSDACKQADGFLYITATTEKVMGAAVALPCVSVAA